MLSVEKGAILSNRYDDKYYHLNSRTIMM